MLHPRFIDAIRFKYPGVNLRQDVVVVDESGVTRLEFWGLADPVPTDAEIDALAQQADAAAAAEAARVAGFEVDIERADLLQRLRTATVAQIDNWIETNVTSLAAARNVLKALVKVLARIG